MIGGSVRYVPVDPRGQLHFSLAADDYAGAVAQVTGVVFKDGREWVQFKPNSQYPDVFRTWGSLRRRGWHIDVMCTAMTAVGRQ